MSDSFIYALVLQILLQKEKIFTVGNKQKPTELCWGNGLHNDYDIEIFCLAAIIQIAIANETRIDSKNDVCTKV